MTSWGTHFIFLIAIFHLIITHGFQVICYYDTFSIKRLGTGNFTNQDLSRALPMCHSIVYGYIGIDAQQLQVTTLHHLQRTQFLKVKQLKIQYPNVKFIISLGGDRDIDKEEKYLKLLKANSEIQNAFIKSALNLLLTYEFDGLDLAYPLLPKHNNNLHDNGSIKNHKLKEYYKNKMTQLIRNLSFALRQNKLMLSLTVLPNVQAQAYYNVTAIIKNLNFVTLAAFDFSQPQLTPKEAHYLAPLYHNHRTDKYSNNQSNVFDVLEQWTWTKLVPTGKLFLGITAHARTWNTTKNLKDPKMPIRRQLNGPAPGGHMTRTPGFLAWPELCKKLGKISTVSIPMYGNYAYRSGFRKSDPGMLITYENRKSIAEKVKFAKKQKLGGVAFFDLSTDDYRGRCWGQRYDLLKVINKQL